MERLTIPARVDSLKDCCAFVRQGAAAAAIPENEMDRLDLVLEEVFMNVARHAYAPAEGEVEVGYMVQRPGKLLVEISDSGRAFNPLAPEPPDFTVPLADRPLGGMGIFLVRQLAGSLEYQRDGGHNRLRFIFPA